MLRIKKPLARKMFYSGYSIVVVPRKYRPDNDVSRAEFNLTECCSDMDFLTLSSLLDRRVNEFEYYNCTDNSTGKTAAFYVTEEDMEKYKLCNLMCG